VGTSPCAHQPGFNPTRSPVWAFGYDWRQSSASHDVRLDGFIAEVLSTEHAEQVVLVTHSMGGLVARAALPRISSHVLGIVHCVQPAVGAVVAARRIMTGYRPSIDGDLGELLQELAAAVGDEAVERLILDAASEPEPTEVGVIEARVSTALFSDSLIKPNPVYYGRLMAGLPGAVELLPSDAAGKAAPWLRPSLPKGPIHDHYAHAPWGRGGLINPAMPASDQSELRTRFAEAKAFHALLSYHSQTGVLFSNGLKTDTAFEPAATPPHIITRGGDGTVPAFSGRCPDLAKPLFRASFSRVDHGQCFADAAFLDAVVAGVDHILRGKSALRDGERPTRVPCLVLA
jgi:pimeloyl-ACP methyl ester carboxylesterase